jgi:tellurite resistance protein TerC
MLAKFSYLEYSLIAILSFVGLKMLLHDFIEMPEWVSLAFIALSPLRDCSSIRKPVKKYYKIQKIIKKREIMRFPLM